MNEEYETYLTKFVLFHRRYDLKNDLGYNQRDFESWEEVKAQLIKDGAVVVVPVYAYDHSCFVLSHQVEPFWWHWQWDSMRVGWAFILRQDVKAIKGWKKITAQRKAELISIIHGNIQGYSNYLNGWSDDDEDLDPDLDENEEDEE